MERLTLLLLTLLFIGCGQKSVSGIYQSTEDKIVEQKWDFREDGSFIYYGASAPKNGSYSIEGDDVVLRADWISASDVEDGKNRFAIENDDLIWSFNNQRLVRSK